jgi:hypothetical protein
MRYLLVLLAASIGWTAPAFAQSDGNCAHHTDGAGGAGMFSDFARGCLELAPELTAPAPSAPALAYHPSPQFKLKGESQAEFEERERRCLATAIYLGHFETTGGGPHALRRQKQIGFSGTASA